MSYYRSYFSKNNTIIKDSNVNTAKNPNTELFYGSSFSKFIFKINLDEVKSKIDNGDLVLNSRTTHTLNLTNTIFGDESYKGEQNGRARERTTSFDLILFPIEEEWDEGVGFDYEKYYDYTTGNSSHDLRPSNWFSGTTLTPWTEEGIYTGTPSTIITTIHFDNGDENITADITDYVNNILTGSTNYGIGLSFHPDYQSVTTDIDQSVAFFTKYTQTFFEPFVETTFYDTIEDDRDSFTIEIENKLYLYVTKGGNFYDLDSLPNVDILDTNGVSITGLTGLTTTKIRKGIYEVSFGISGDLCVGKKFFYDKWTDLYIDGVMIEDVTQRFVPEQFSENYNIGGNIRELERYVVQFFGVNSNEKIKRDEIRKITITFRSINEPQNILFNDVYYRLYIKEGRTQVNVYDWTKLDRTNENTFMLDTSFLIPREYWLEIKAKTHNEEIFYENEIKFEIVSER